MSTEKNIQCIWCGKIPGPEQIHETDDILCIECYLKALNTENQPTTFEELKENKNVIAY